MITYEVYDAPPCSCASEWHKLGKLEVSSEENLHLLLNKLWPNVAHILAIDIQVGTITSLNTVERSVVNSTHS